MSGFLLAAVLSLPAAGQGLDPFENVSSERLADAILGMAPATDSTALVRAAIACEMDEVRSLAAKVDVDQLDQKTGTRAINAAAYSGCLDAVDFLAGEKNAELDLPDLMGWTPLMTASYACHPDVVGALLRRRADRAAMDRAGDTAASLASKASRGPRSRACADVISLLNAPAD